MGSQRPTCATSISAGGRDELYAHLDEDLFVAEFTRHFTIVMREQLTNGRVLFLFETK